VNAGRLLYVALTGPAPWVAIERVRPWRDPEGYLPGHYAHAVDYTDSRGTWLELELTYWPELGRYE
jgi:hypothetical protein